MLMLSVVVLSGCINDDRGDESFVKKPYFIVKNAYTETGFEGIDFVLYVFADVKNYGTAPGIAYVYCQVTQSGNTYLRRDHQYLDAGETWSIRFRFNEISFWSSGGHYKVWVES